jgi:hypothetical protein
MSRRLPRAFFWVDQQIIRLGIWTKLSPLARLTYISLSASVDREGISIWSHHKLRELSGCCDRDELNRCLGELAEHSLIERFDEQIPPAIRLCNLQSEGNESQTKLPDHTTKAQSAKRPSEGAASVIVHTHTTIHLGSTHVDSRTTV